MESQATKTFSDAVVVWPDDLRHFDSFLRKNFTKVEYKAACEDDTKLKASGLTDLLEYENPDFKRLVSITINASDGQPLGDSVEITIQTKRGQTKRVTKRGHPLKVPCQENRVLL